MKCTQYGLCGQTALKKCKVNFIFRSGAGSMGFVRAVKKRARVGPSAGQM